MIAFLIRNNIMNSCVLCRTFKVRREKCQCSSQRRRVHDAFNSCNCIISTHATLPMVSRRTQLSCTSNSFIPLSPTLIRRQTFPNLPVLNGTSDRIILGIMIGTLTSPYHCIVQNYILPARRGPFRPAPTVTAKL